MRAYRVVCATLVWFALGLQYWLVLRGAGGGSVVERTVNFFSYFTILTNIACALAFTLPALVPRSGLGRLFTGFGARTALAVYLLVVGATYVLILRHLWAPQGPQWVADSLLHYVMPVLFLIDWLALTPKARLPWAAALRWLAYPALYSAWTLIHGAMSGFYPYPFADVGALGYPRALLNLATMMGVFAVAGLSLIGLARLIERDRRPA